MSQPSFSCPRCGYETFLPSDIAAGYCPSCRWWTGDSLLGGDDVMAQNVIDGPLSIAPVSDALRSDVEAEWFGDRPCVMQPADDCSAVLPCADCLIVYGVELAPGPAVRIPRRIEPRGVYRVTQVEGPTYRVARFVRALRRFRR